MTQPDIDVSFAEAGALGNELLNKLNAMREVDPIYWSERNGGVWIVTGHRETVEGFRGNLPLSAFRLPHLVVGSIPPEEREARIPYMMHTLPKWVINMDPPGQPRLRRLMMKAFSRKVTEDIRPFARQFINEALDDAERQREPEFVSTVARKIPARVILRMLGLPDSLLAKMHHWSISLNATLGGIGMPAEVLEEGERTMLEMRSYFLPEIEKRRTQPSDDFISALVTAHEEGDKLSEEEMLGILFVTLIAGHDTTANTMAMGTAALAQHPEARDFIRRNPAQTMNSVMEIMRYVAMSTMQARIATEDFGWHGHDIKAGQLIFLMIAGANRDPQIFSEPNKLDLTRGQDANMTFAPGLHFCIGHLLAKMQLTEFFPALVERYDPELLDTRLNFGVSVAFRGLETLHVRMNKRN